MVAKVLYILPEQCTILLKNILYFSCTPTAYEEAGNTYLQFERDSADIYQHGRYIPACYRLLKKVSGGVKEAATLPKGLQFSLETGTIRENGDTLD